MQDLVDQGDILQSELDVESSGVLVHADLATNRNLWKRCWMLRVIKKTKRNKFAQSQVQGDSGASLRNMRAEG